LKKLNFNDYKDKNIDSGDEKQRNYVILYNA